MKRFIAIIMTLCLILGLSSVSVWATEAATWQSETPVPEKTNPAEACTVGNKIYVFGAISSGHTVKIYDTETDTWAIAQSMPIYKTGFGCSLVEGKVYIIGGSSKSVEIYDIQTDTWTMGQPMTVTRQHISSSAVGDKIYVFGGSDAGNKWYTTVEIYDTQTDTWTTGQSMPTKRDQLSTAAVGNKIYVFGGSGGSGNILDKVEIYDTQTDTWTTGQSMPTRRCALSLSVVGNKIYVIGGYSPSESYLDKVEIYDTQTDTWTNGPSMLTKRQNLGTTAVGGKIYAIGGINSSGALKVVESLDVSNEMPTPSLAVLLEEGDTVQLSNSYNLNKNTNYTWSSTNESVATVDGNGKVTAVSAGNTDIYVQDADGTFNECIPIKVVAGTDVLRSAVHLKIGETAALYVTDDISEVTWSSMDESIATVSSDGVIIGINRGLTIIQATYNGEMYQIYVRVTR
ncbi:Kelch repeat-containing protein [Clostridium aminobutyricum]|uniref:Ig-like domain-containing protein n=1 Tax=Clostridium aminobutyricum TaxID=33953 RepID=A0A939IJM9_CLOAM|nr:kelch repeat-containing protein [Clostridium aminobutyricum]MBN7773744.1 Ig-like domain-containing protein [Clostridium aminobutyricum]